MAPVYPPRSSPVRRELIKALPFLEWAQIHPYDVKALRPDLDDLLEVFISPDVHSLHIVWAYRCDPLEVYHEIADFPMCPVGEEWGPEDTQEFLSQEIGDDSWEVVQGQTVFEVISDIREITRENVRIISLKDLWSNPLPDPYGSAGG